MRLSRRFSGPQANLDDLNVAFDTDNVGCFQVDWSPRGSLKQMGVCDLTQIKPCGISEDFAFVPFSWTTTRVAGLDTPDSYISGNRNFIKIIDRHFLLISLVGGEYHETFLIDPGFNADLNRVECSGTGFVQLSFSHGHLCLRSNHEKKHPRGEGKFLQGAPSRSLGDDRHRQLVQYVCRNGLSFRTGIGIRLAEAQKEKAETSIGPGRVWLDTFERRTLPQPFHRLACQLVVTLSVVRGRVGVGVTQQGAGGLDAHFAEPWSPRCAAVEVASAHLDNLVGTHPGQHLDLYHRGNRWGEAREYCVDLGLVGGTHRRTFGRVVRPLARR